MRNAITIPFTKEETLVITTDNSGGIGMMEQDKVKVPYEVVSYYLFRVAIMECIAARATPISVVLHNFCGEEPWDSLTSGVKKGLTELGLEDVGITGSTESNFPLHQSALSINVIGKKPNTSLETEFSTEDSTVALIGLPLVGDEVTHSPSEIAPLSVFKQIAELKHVHVWPVGSKGILSEWKRFRKERAEQISSSAQVDVLKSGGPSTSFLVAYDKEMEGLIKEIAGTHFRSLSNE